MPQATGVRTCHGTSVLDCTVNCVKICEASRIKVPLSYPWVILHLKFACFKSRNYLKNLWSSSEGRRVHPTEERNEDWSEPSLLEECGWRVYSRPTLKTEILLTSSEVVCCFWGWAGWGWGMDELYSWTSQQLEKAAWNHAALSFLAWCRMEASRFIDCSSKAPSFKSNTFKYM